MRRLLCLGLLLLLASCGEDMSSPDGGPDTDAGPGSMDGGGGVDGGGVDGGGGVDATAPGEDGGGPGEDGGGPGEDGGVRPDAGPRADGGPEACAAPPLPSLSIELVVSGLRRPVFVTQAPGVTDTLWIVEKRGRIRLVRGGAVLGTDFLDITGTIGPEPAMNDERGLLGLAFAPDYETSGRFFVYYTPTRAADRNDVVAEYRVSADPDVAAPGEVARLVETSTLENNHNGGMIAFGPDGFLYVGTGDGGGANDAHGAFGNGLNTDTLLGKILRLDIDAAGAGYAAATNPFVGGGGRPQIWAYGLRNPWRFSFDRLTGDLYIGDVGQNAWEEIDIQPAASPGGENYGWRAYEGNEVFRPGDVSRVSAHAEPALVYAHFAGDEEVIRGGCSITGGYVYRGSAIPDLQGWYFYSDFCSADVGAFRWCEGAVLDHTRVTGLVPPPTGRGTASFGEDNAGEVYVVNHVNGTVHRLVSP